MSKTVTSDLLKILIVEDSTSIASRLKGLLSDLTEHECVGVAGTVAKALQLISLNLPDVVILDIHLQDEMPGVTGIDLLRILKKDYPEIKVMMFTNYSEDQYRDRCEKLGASYFFDKSADFEKIPATLDEISTLRKSNTK
jgi:DNA-binding NarL/FixJ family response regulator